MFTRPEFSLIQTTSRLDETMYKNVHSVGLPGPQYQMYKWMNGQTTKCLKVYKRECV